MIKTTNLMNIIMSSVSLLMVGYHLILAPDTEYSTKSMIFWCAMHIISDIRLMLGNLSITAMIMPQIKKLVDEEGQPSTHKGSTILDKEESNKG